MSAAARLHSDNACIAPDLVGCANVVAAILKRRGKTLVTAESCTAGLIAAVMSQTDSAAEVLHGSFVTYTKANKTAALGVPAGLLEKKGSVNAEVATAMAEGALMRSPADIALAVTGVLGPEADEDGNPVGLIYISCAARNAEPLVRREDFGRQDPDVLRHRTVTLALELLARTLTPDKDK